MPSSEGIAKRRGRQKRKGLTDQWQREAAKAAKKKGPTASSSKETKSARNKK